MQGLGREVFFALAVHCVVLKSTRYSIRSATDRQTDRQSAQNEVPSIDHVRGHHENMLSQLRPLTKEQELAIENGKVVMH